MLLVAAVLAPPAIFALVLFWQFSVTERDRSRAEAEGLAEQLCSTIDRELVGLTAALEGLATSPALRAGGDLAAFHRQAQELLRTRGSYIIMRDRTGQQVISSTVPFGTALPRQTDAATLALDRAVFETGRPVISDLRYRLTTGRPHVLVDVPVFRGGQVEYALHASLDADRLAAIFAEAARPDWTVSLIDRNDRIIARSRRQETYVGQLATPDLREATKGDRGTWLGKTLDGTPVVGAYARSALSGWRVAVGVSENLIEAPLRRLILLILGSAALVGLLATMLALRAARTISQPIARLATAAGCLERGEPVPQLRTGLAEVDEVAGALAAAERAIAARGAALQASEERFRAAVRAVDGVIWTNDPAGRMTGEQPGWSALTGQSQHEYRGHGWAHAVHPEDAVPTVRAWEQAVREHRTFNFVHRVRVADGTYRRFSVRAVPVIGANGAVREWVGVHTDITDEHEAKASLAESQARLRAVFEAVPVGVVIAEAPRGTITEGNAQAERILGRRSLEGREAGEHWTAFHPDGRRVGTAEFPLARVVRDGEERPELEARFLRASGEMVWVRLIAAPIRDAAGRVAGGVVAILDIDRLKRAETGLRELNATLERRVQETAEERDRIWRISTELMMVARFDTTIIALNPAWSRTLGWAESDMRGRRSIDFVHPDDVEPSLAEAARLAEGGPTLRFENRYRHQDGSYRWLSWTAVPEAGLLHAIARDVTAEKEAEAALRRTEEQLRQSQKMEVVGQLTGGIAHDFNNLLTVVTGHLEMARRRVEAEGDDPRLLRHLGSAFEGARRAAVLTHRLLAFSRQSPLRPEVLDLNTVIEGMTDLIRRTLGETIEVATVLERRALARPRRPQRDRERDPQPLHQRPRRDAGRRTPADRDAQCAVRRGSASRPARRTGGGRLHRDRGG